MVVINYNVWIRLGNQVLRIILINLIPYILWCLLYSKKGQVVNLNQDLAWFRVDHLYKIKQVVEMETSVALWMCQIILAVFHSNLSRSSLWADGPAASEAEL